METRTDPDALAEALLGPGGIHAGQTRTMQRIIIVAILRSYAASELEAAQRFAAEHAEWATSECLRFRVAELRAG